MLHPLGTAAAAGYNRRRWSLHQSFPIEATFTHRAAREWEQVRERHIVFPPWRLALTPFAPMPPCKSTRLCEQHHSRASVWCDVDAPVAGHIQ